MNLGDFFAPHFRAFQYVGFIDRADAATALRCEVKGDAGNADDFRAGIDLGVDAAAGAVGQGFDAAGMAEINAAGKFADDHDVEPGDDVVL